MKQTRGQVMLYLLFMFSIVVAGCGARNKCDDYSTLYPFSGIRGDRFEVIVEKMKQFASRPDVTPFRVIAGGRA